jgi:hypothetical protein
MHVLLNSVISLPYILDMADRSIPSSSFAYWIDTSDPDKSVQIITDIVSLTIYETILISYQYSTYFPYLFYLWNEYIHLSISPIGFQIPSFEAQSEYLNVSRKGASISCDDPIGAPKKLTKGIFDIA